ncbi:hypothetical protein ONS96_004434 [Cadophora gregata f. sp. sojae]|nr:hypothetical protein ONS96_004434 [Cadophora gregata f. sp. sojae]
MSSIIKAISRSSSEADLSRNPSHEARRQLSWLNYCAKNHKSCNEPWEDEFFPTRLVDVSSFPFIRLIKTKDLETRDRRYVALNYCWGLPMQDEGKTVLATLEAHQNAIVLEKLP